VEPFHPLPEGTKAKFLKEDKLCLVRIALELATKECTNHIYLRVEENREGGKKVKKDRIYRGVNCNIGQCYFSVNGNSSVKCVGT
jgi:hypothetical protein